MSPILPALPVMARYAMSAGLEMAKLPAEQRLTADALAERTGAPRPILSKVLASLVRAGLVDGVKGHYGGYRLARAAKTITLLEVASAVFQGGPHASEIPCALGNTACHAEDPCPLHDAWMGVVVAVEAMVRHNTLADLIEK